MTPIQIAPNGPMSDAEWATRVDLAAAYRLCELYGMSDLIYTHLSARVPDEPDCFLLNPHGHLFEEITASSLMKVRMDGELVGAPPGTPMNKAGHVIHSGIYLARHDAHAVVHTHTIAGMAVASLKEGLLPLTQTSHRVVGRLAYHDFNGPERDPAEREALARNIGDKPYAILRNHGLLTAGPTIAEAFNYMYILERACQAQMAILSCGREINFLPDAVVEKSVGMYAPGQSRAFGLLEWPAMLRKLDRIDRSFRD